MVGCNRPRPTRPTGTGSAPARCGGCRPTRSLRHRPCRSSRRQAAPSPRTGAGGAAVWPRGGEPAGGAQAAPARLSARAVPAGQHALGRVGAARARTAVGRCPHGGSLLGPTMGTLIGLALTSAVRATRTGLQPRGGLLYALRITQWENRRFW